MCLIRLVACRFEFDEDNSDFLPDLASNMALYPPEHVVTGPFRCPKICPKEDLYALLDGMLAAGTRGDELQHGIGALGINNGTGSAAAVPMAQQRGLQRAASSESDNSAASFSSWGAEPSDLGAASTSGLATHARSSSAEPAAECGPPAGCVNSARGREPTGVSASVQAADGAAGNAHLTRAATKRSRCEGVSPVLRADLQLSNFAQAQEALRHVRGFQVGFCAAATLLGLCVRHTVLRAAVHACEGAAGAPPCTWL